MLDLQDLPAFAWHLCVASIRLARPVDQYRSPGAIAFASRSITSTSVVRAEQAGLQARVGRHLRGDGTRHWHIDYLRAVR